MEAKSRSYTFSFCVTRTDPDGVDNGLVSFTRGLGMVDIVLILGLLTVFVLEPFGIYLFLTRHQGPLSAGKCKENQNVVLVPMEGGAGYRMVDEEGREVITPLNARDPSSLVIGVSP
ncbi:MAG: hypothetical protein WC728_18240 [Elusimicrobiota bacterium]